MTSSTKDDPSYDAVETILKGPEISLGDVHYHDKDGNFRDRARIAWWKESVPSLSIAAMIPGGTDIRDATCMPTSLPDRRLADHGPTFGWLDLDDASTGEVDRLLRAL